jgi:hypothetical protein
MRAVSGPAPAEQVVAGTAGQHIGTDVAEQHVVAGIAEQAGPRQCRRRRRRRPRRPKPCRRRPAHRSCRHRVPISRSAPLVGVGLKGVVNSA